MTEQLTGAELKDSRHSSSVMLSHPADRLHINPDFPLGDFSHFVEVPAIAFA